MEGQLFLQVGALALLTLEGLKWFVRRVVLRNPSYEFAPLFYEFLVPFLTALWGFGFSYLPPELGFPVVEDPISWQALVQWFLAILSELALYHMGVERFKEFRASRMSG